MATLTEVRVPNIGDFDEVPVVEILVAPGDSVAAEDALLTLESDKASMDVPSPHAGVIKELRVTVGDKVSQGALVLTIEVDAENVAEVVEKPAEAGAASTQTIEVLVPDIGDFDAVPVIEVMVVAGDEVQADDALITMESDKASMDIPAPVAGKILEVKASLGDKLSQGDVILILEGVADSPASQAPNVEPPVAVQETPKEPISDTQHAPGTPHSPARRPSPTASLDRESQVPKKKPHATPSVRRFARSLGADLDRVTGTGRKGRLLKEDVTRHIKDIMTQSASSGGGTGIPQMPAIDFSKFGEIETQPLSRIKKISGANLHRAWLVMPHVTHHDEADITELEAFRKAEGEKAKQRGIRLTPLAFIMKACVAALKAHPTVNSSLDPAAENLILKHYFHIGVAVDTPDGLMVPVIRDVDKKGIEALAEELGVISAKAREKKLGPGDMQGACFTISSLGGIGGTAFTPIVNAPEVAILGVARSSMKPVYTDGEFVPRLMLPMSLSYDHRVIDGAAAARFTRFLCDVLTDIRRLLL